MPPKSNIAPPQFVEFSDTGRSQSTIEAITCAATALGVKAPSIRVWVNATGNIQPPRCDAEKNSVTIDKRVLTLLSDQELCAYIASHHEFSGQKRYVKSEEEIARTLKAGLVMGGSFATMSMIFILAAIPVFSKINDVTFTRREAIVGSLTASGMFGAITGTANADATHGRIESDNQRFLQAVEPCLPEFASLVARADAKIAAHNSTIITERLK